MVRGSIKQFVELTHNILSGRDISIEDYGNSGFTQICTLGFGSVVTVRAIAVMITSKDASKL